WDQAEAFGNSAPNENPSALGAFTLNLRFPGQTFDKETGLFYNVNRDYRATSGRYIESDPIGLAGGINTYAYVGGNPLNYFDILGLAGGPIDLGQGYTGRLDQFPGSGGKAGMEIHVYDPKGNEIGLYGKDGWFNKHGHLGRPESIPESVENQCRGQAVDWARRAGFIPEKGTVSIKGRSVGSFMRGGSMPSASGALGVMSILSIILEAATEAKCDADRDCRCSRDPDCM
ncbi:RHS repeat-associated core domain-containing protein, partial [Ideonella azotifigens]